jgi:hypothetical protein
MRNIKSLTIAAVAALALGLSTAMAQQAPHGPGTAASPAHAQAHSTVVDHRTALFDGMGG